MGFIHDLCFDDSDITIRDSDEEDAITLVKAATEKHKGDLFTKEMPRARLEQSLEMIGMIQQDRADGKLAAMHSRFTAT